ncbi:hypothetical protein [Nonomuraea basaltis]|uniref:hypothetical protein n=1 Tax=Nonomuraea basaltis TaxID=2495887 RepID=UPI0014869EBB|nr:hypothetical protein [Nonomuraea basaltis]
MYEIIEALVPPAIVAAVFLLGVRAVLKKERADRARERSAADTAKRAFPEE